ncbi:MAG: hypothetical protein ACQSGP_26365 [Frankia sp.]
MFHLIGVALLRARVISVPAAWLLIISAPLHLVFAVVVPSNALSAIAWGLTAIGFAAAGRAIVAPVLSPPATELTPQRRSV